MATKGSLKIGGEPSLSGICSVRSTSHIPASSPEGPLQSVDYQGVTRLKPLFCFLSLPYKSKLLTAVVENKISIAFAMLTP